MTVDLNTQIALSLFDAGDLLTMGIVDVPDYSTDAGYVTEIIDALRRKGFGACIFAGEHQGQAHFFVWIQNLKDQRPKFWGEAETLPMALCKAALKAKEDF